MQPTIACLLRSGSFYDGEWVRRLRDACARWAPPHRFICLTDIPDEVPCEAIRLRHDWPGWWSKIEVFRDDIAAGPLLFLDLDVVVCGPLSPLFDRPEPFIAGCDWTFHQQFGSAAFLHDAGSLRSVYETFLSDPAGAMERSFAPAAPNKVYGDQVFIDAVLPMRPAWMQQVLPGFIEPIHRHLGSKPPRASLVGGFGRFKPHTITNWWSREWSGASAIAWGTVDERHETAVIVCSGASLRDIDPAEVLGASDCVIAVNGAIDWLGRADHWVTVDPGEENRARLKGPRLADRYWMAVPEDYGHGAAKAAAHREAAEAGVTFLRRLPRGATALAETDDSLNGGNSGFGALNLACHMGARRIVILGLDGHPDRTRFDGTTSRGSLDHLPSLFASAARQLRSRGIQVVNANPLSAVTCFPRMPAPEALRWLNAPAGRAAA